MKTLIIFQKNVPHGTVFGISDHEPSLYHTSTSGHADRDGRIGLVWIWAEGWESENIFKAGLKGIGGFQEQDERNAYVAL